MLIKNEEKLCKIRDDIFKLGENISSANKKILLGLKEKNIQDFEDSYVFLRNMESSANSIDNEIVTSLALFGAEASDLRELVSYLKITNEFIRISDNIKAFTKAIIATLNESGNFTIYQDYTKELCKTALQACNLAIGSLIIENNIEQIYREVVVYKSKCDDLYSILEKVVLNKLSTIDGFSLENMEILSRMRKLQNIADRSIAIVKLMLYARSGGKLKLY